MGKCGGRKFLRINEDHNYRLLMSYGPTTNTRVELLALSRLLHFTSIIGIDTIQVLGDSKVIVN